MIKKIKNKIVNSKTNLRRIEKTLLLLIKIVPNYSFLHYVLGRTLGKMGQGLKAEDAFKTAIALNNKKWKYHLYLAKNLKDQGRWWQKVDVLKDAAELNGTSAGLYYRLAHAQEKMNLLSDAAVSYGKAIDLYEQHTEWMYFNYGYALQRAGNTEASQEAFSQAIKLDKNKKSQELGIGIFHEKKGYWRAALEAYKEKAEEEPENALLHYKLGLAYDRNYDWDNAKKSMEHAISLDTTNAHWFYRLGFVCERSKKWEVAEKAYKSALERQETFTPYWFYRLGYVLNKQGKNQEASEAFLEQRILQTAHGASENSFKKNKNFKQVATYAEYFQKNDIQKNSIIYESYGGVGMSCNPYAIFLDIIQDQRFEGWKHVWVIDDNSKIPEKYRKLKNVFLVKKNSDLYLRYLSTCEYLINNSTFPPYFIRRPEQKYLNTWHGTPLKTLGIDIKDSPYQRANTARNFLHATHMITPNRHTTDVLINRYGVNGILNGKVAETGYPRIDLTLNISDDRKNELIDMMKLDSSKPIVLYAPTYRGLWNTPEIETNKLLSDLEALKSDKFHLVFRGHYFAEQKIKELNLPIKLAPHSIDSCELLSIVDVLISDYSSIFYDFLPTERPIIHYVHDYDEYSETRGMYFGIDELPGTICHTAKDVLDTLDTIMTNPHQQLGTNYRQAKDKFSLYEDGQSTKRTIEFFFFDNIKEKYLAKNEYDKKTLLFYASPFDANGITSSIINLTNNIDKDKYGITIVIDRVSLVGHPERIEQLNKLDKNINVIIRSGRMVTTVEEQWVRDKFVSYNKLEDEEMHNIYKKAFEREFTRMFGYHRFDAIIDFHGYRPFWASLFAFGASKNKNIYLHNDMYKEYLIRFPYLEATFNLYKYFDKLISVSESVSESNKSLLSKKYSIPESLFDFCNNPINFKEYETLSNETLDSSEYESFMQDKRKKFINAARLSPEKGQMKLIEAFSKILKSNKEIALYIMGTGPLSAQLQHKINALGVQENIILLGYQSNPYPYIKNSDCMILSSEHEGQGIVLLEALFFGIPCISTDIPGPRSVLSNGYGILVGESSEDIAQSMENFINGQYNFKTFDSLKYNQNALDMFYEKVINTSDKTPEETL